MALVGGGGAGNTAGSNPSGTGSSLNYIGNHAYGYSGIVLGTGGNETTLLEFNTGALYIKGKVQFNQALNTGEDILNRIYFDNQVIQQYTGDNTGPQFRESRHIYLIIPPFTTVKCTCDNVTDTGNVSNLVSITGRVYA